MNKHLRKLWLCLLVAPISVIGQEADDVEPIDCSLEENQNETECIALQTEGLVDEIVVTGTYLQRDKFTSPSPIEVITFEDIQQFGASQIGDYARALPATLSSNTINNPGDVGGFGATQNGVDTSVNLRGFGNDGTITLVNGVRATTSLDANSLVPEIALERAEVLLDGAGALYGADTIAGAVNFISRKSYEGVRVNTYRNGDADSYEDWKFSILAGEGYDFLNLDLVTSLEVQNRTTLANLERPKFARAAQSVSEYANPGTFTDVGVDPNCATLISGLNYSDPGQSGFAPTGVLLDSNGNPTNNPANAESCGFLYDEFQDYLPDLERYLWNTNVRFDATDFLEVDYSLTLSYREATTRNSPMLGNDADELSIPADHPARLADPALDTGTAISPVNANFRPFGKLGTRPSSFNGDGSRNEYSDTYQYNHTLSFNYDFWDTSWRGTTYASTSSRSVSERYDVISKSKIHAATNGLGGPNCGFDTTQLIGLEDDPGFFGASAEEKRQDILDANQALAGIDGCGYYNPFLSAGLATMGLADPALANSQALINWMTEEVDYESTRTETRTWESRVAGEVIDLPAGPLQLVVGYNYRLLSFETWQNPYESIDDDLNGPSFDTFFSEDVRSQFVELAVPILHNLDFSTAFRREEYTNRPFDPVTKPKYAISYRPIEDLALRASYSESFTAPSFDQLDESDPLEIPTLFFVDDPFNENNPAIPAPQGTYLLSGNAGLKPEETETINIGYTYRGIEDWEFSMDFQEIKYFDRIVNARSDVLLGRPYFDFISQGGDPSNTSEVIAYLNANPHPNVTRDPTTGRVTELKSIPINIDELVTRFVDVKVRHNMDTRWGLFSAELTATGYDEFLYVPADSFESQAVDAVGQRNRDVTAAVAMPRWKGNLVVRWANNNHSIVARTDYQSGVQFDGNVATGAAAPSEVKQWATLDLRYGYSFAQLWGGSADIAAGVTNLFDREAQGLPIRQGFESRLHDPYGRRIYIDLTYEF